MKHKKGLLAVILMVVLLTFAVGGTIAYLMDKTGTVANTFEPTKVDTKIVETISGNEKTSIVIENKEGSIPAYVRVAIVGNWCDSDGNIVEAWTPGFTLGSGWEQKGDYYYYTDPLAEYNKTGYQTNNLLGSNINTIDEANHPGLHLEITVMQQAIQAEGMGVASAVDAFSKAAQ